MTSLPAVARLVLAAPMTPHDAHAVAGLVDPYAPGRLAALPGVAPEAVEVLASYLDMACELLGGDAGHVEALDALAAREVGETVVVLVPREVLPLAIAHALGVPSDAARRFDVSTQAISVLERDAEGHWAVVRVNEGAFPLPHA